MQNIGQVTNKGIELSISGDILQGKDFVLSGSFTFGHNKMKIDKLNGTDQVIWDQNDRWKSSYNDYCLKVGDEVGLIYGFVYDGIYGFDEFYYDATNSYQALPWGSSIADNERMDVQPREDGYVTVINDVSSTTFGKATLPGRIKFKDLDGDGRITENDRTVIGNTNPKFQGGFGLSGQWKDFDFNANFTYKVGNQIYNANKIQTSSRYRNGSYPNLRETMSPTNAYSYINPETGALLTTLEDLAYWNEGGNGRGAKSMWSPFSTGDAVVVPTDWAMDKASFLRLQSLTVGYTIPKKIIKKIGFERLRLYVTATNLFCITNYPGFDPEVSSYARNSSYSGLTPGIDFSSYPKSRAWTFGINVTM
jgi:hypothetical protein